MKKSLAWLTSALKTRTTVRLRLCASEKPERSLFLNNANGRYTGIIMNEIHCIKKVQSLIHATKTSSILESLVCSQCRSQEKIKREDIQ